MILILFNKLKTVKDWNVLCEIDSVRLFMCGSIIRINILLETFIFIESWFIAAPSPKEKRDLRRIFFEKWEHIGSIRSEKQQNGSYFFCMRNNRSVLIGCWNSLELWSRSKAHTTNFIRKIFQNVNYALKPVTSSNWRLNFYIKSSFIENYIGIRRICFFEWISWVSFILTAVIVFAVSAYESSLFAKLYSFQNGICYKDIQVIYPSVVTTSMV